MLLCSFSLQALDLKNASVGGVRMLDNWGGGGYWVYFSGEKFSPSSEEQCPNTKMTKQIYFVPKSSDMHDAFLSVLLTAKVSEQTLTIYGGECLFGGYQGIDSFIF
jgi:hypothetical protein